MAKEIDWNYCCKYCSFSIVFQSCNASPQISTKSMRETFLTVAIPFHVSWLFICCTISGIYWYFFRKSRVSALTVSASNFFPPAAVPCTEPRAPLVDGAGAAGAGFGAGGAGISSFLASTGAAEEEKCEHSYQQQKQLHYNLYLITLTRRGRSRSSFNLLLFNRCWYWGRCRGGFSLLFNWCGRRCTLLSGSLSLSIGLLSSGGCVV